MSQLTTHILNTSTGKPASGVAVKLEILEANIYTPIASGITNADGRVTDFVEKNKVLQPGNYRISFDTVAYFKSLNQQCFYPQVVIDFFITDASHYHVPLLLSAFGYSTYRGS
jgi:5-hydroxyisourate hydrolase